MVSTNKIKGRIRELGLTQMDIAQAMGKSENTVNSKINGKRDFTVSEIECLCDILNVDERDAYFFVK